MRVCMPGFFCGGKRERAIVRPQTQISALCGYADSPKGVQGGERKATLLA